MKRNKEKVPGFDEIIFENRNKEYGAFDLRKRYNSTGSFSILGGTLVFAGIILGLTFTIEEKGTATVDLSGVIIKVDPINPELLNIKKPELPKPVVNTNLSKYQTPVIVSDTAEITNNFATADAFIDSVKNGNVNEIDTVIINTGSGILSEPNPVFFVEEMPTFPGGEHALLKLISESIKYPQQAIDNGIQGHVILRFVVSSDGSVTKVEILKGVDPLLNVEAVRVVSSLPKWKPGKQGGKPVPVWFSVPVTFRLENN